MTHKRAATYTASSGVLSFQRKSAAGGALIACAPSSRRPPGNNLRASSLPASATKINNKERARYAGERAIRKQRNARNIKRKKRKNRHTRAAAAAKGPAICFSVANPDKQGCMKQRASDAAAAGTVEASKAGRASPSARLVRQGKRGTRPSANAISVRRRGAGGSPARSHLLTRSEQKPSGQGITWYQRANRRPLAVLLLVPAAGRRRRQRQQSAARTIFQRSLGAASVGFFRSLWWISTPRLDRFRPLLIGSDGECRICTLPRMRHCMRHVAATPRSRAASDFWSPVCATGRLRACQHGDSGKVRRSSALPGFSRGSRGCCRRRSSLAGGGCSGAHGVRPKRWFERRHRDFAGTARYREV